MTKTLVSIAASATLVLALLAGPRRAHADFGEKGQIILSGDTNGSLAYESISPPSGSSTSRTSIVFQPSLDAIVAPNVTLGGAVIASYSGSDPISETQLGLAPRVGYLAKLSDTITLWPRFGFEFVHTSTDFTISPTIPKQNTTSDGLAIVASMPLVLHITTHLFLGVGPEISVTLYDQTDSKDGDKTTRLAVNALIGGWF